MSRTLVIAECGSSWDCDLSKAFRLIDAAKACDADVAKFQWTSNAFAMARRRGLGADAAAMYVKYLQYPVDTLRQLKAHCDEVGIEFLVTAYLIEDIATIAPLVKRFKVSAFEAGWVEFIDAHSEHEKPIIISRNKLPEWNERPDLYGTDNAEDRYCNLWCVSEYPTDVAKLSLRSMVSMLETYANWSSVGLSDHTTSTLTGALAVAAGATIVEKHIRLHDTDKGNPDYGHSLIAGSKVETQQYVLNFSQYVSNIREAERAL